MTEASKSRRARGEITRVKILEAALRLIEVHGHRAVTHRSVAAEAGVNLSLTTYYFKDLKALIAEAFSHYCAKETHFVEGIWQQVNAHLDTLDLDKLEQRVEVKSWLADLAADFIVNQVTNRPSELILEMTLYFDLHLDSELRETAINLMARFESDFIGLAKRLHSDEPLVDAALLLGEVQRLQFKGLVDKEVDRSIVRAHIARLLSWVLKV